MMLTFSTAKFVDDWILLIALYSVLQPTNYWSISFKILWITVMIRSTKIKHLQSFLCSLISTSTFTRQCPGMKWEDNSCSLRQTVQRAWWARLCETAKHTWAHANFASSDTPHPNNVLRPTRTAKSDHRCSSKRAHGNEVCWPFTEAFWQTGTRQWRQPTIFSNGSSFNNRLTTATKNQIGV